jgi:prepilin-type N-terminal cleavage/methylation domain-containing protein
MNKHYKTKPGFTIIEVVLVLAIAGLIFLMVFLALPALQRSQRDTARKNDVGIIVSAISAYAGNNRGAIPAGGLTFTANATTGKWAATGTDTGGFTSYIQEVSKSITTVKTIAVTTTVSSGANDDTIVVGIKAKCSATAGSFDVGAGRQTAVIIKLESGNGQFYCQDA